MVSLIRKFADSMPNLKIALQCYFYRKFIPSQVAALDEFDRIDPAEIVTLYHLEIAGVNRP